MWWNASVPLDVQWLLFYIAMAYYGYHVIGWVWNKITESFRKAWEDGETTEGP